ncbi:hypothetical protein TNCT_422881 [Trichonephila clavata]|uniref:Uncharacterized protein n=1 Tax=Trichonephila clavata TaxID=2740835 RepID=A0A8X6IZ24_TRICU|nr:hypothetical protein TNCT_422881 [Trichonephila clavata]
MKNFIFAVVFAVLVVFSYAEEEKKPDVQGRQLFGGLGLGGHPGVGLGPGSYGQGGYRHGGYGQSQYGQGAYNRGSYDRGTYNQGAYGHGGQSHGGYGQGGYGHGYGRR